MEKARRTAPGRCRFPGYPNRLCRSPAPRAGTFRCSCMVASKMRDDMLQDGKDEALENLISEARRLQDTLQSGLSE